MCAVDRVKAMPPPVDFGRTQWVNLGRSLVDAALEHREQSGASIVLPGAPSKHGESFDGLEGFSRTFLTFASIAAGEPEAFTPQHAERFREGIAAGLGAGGTQRLWPTAVPKGHSIVDAGTIALALRLLPEAFVASLDADVVDALAQWLRAHAVAETPDNNWVVFRLSIASQLRRMGLTDAALDELVTHSRRRLDDWYDPATGWYSDGDSRTFDYYNAFEFHVVPPLIAHLDGDSAALVLYRERLDTFLVSLSELIDAHGLPVYVGRSLTYRFAIAAPFALAALIGTDGAVARERAILARSMVSTFLDRGAIDEHGLLLRGWYSAQPELAQEYSGPAAAYFAGRVFIALLLAQNHEFWGVDARTTPPQPRAPRTLPRHPHWLIDPAPDGSLVRLVNHGSTDRVNSIMRRRFDDPMYSRVGYSTATAPVEAAGHVDRGVKLVVDGVECSRGIIVPNHSGERWVSSWSHPRQLTDKPAAGAEGAWKGRDLEGLFVHYLTALVDGWQVDVCAVVGETSRVHQISLGGWAVADASAEARLTRVRRRRGELRSERLVAELVALHAPSARLALLRSTSPQPFGTTADFHTLIVPTRSPWRRGPLRTDRTLWVVAAHRLESLDSSSTRTKPSMRGRLTPRLFSGITVGSGENALRVVLDDSGLRATS